MRDYYKPSENRIIRNFEFRQLAQKSGETFSAFCNRVDEAGKECHFCDCDTDANCTASQYAIRDQIVIGTHDQTIREKSMLKDWNLADLRSKGMKCESASAGEEKISGSGAINRLGKYSYKNLKKTNGKVKTEARCYRCDLPFFPGHMKQCKALKFKCKNCGKVGHYTEVCNQKDAKLLSNDSSKEREDSESHTLQMRYYSNTIK